MRFVRSATWCLIPTKSNWFFSKNRFSLQTVNLSHNELSALSARAFGEMFALNTTLDVLELGWNALFVAEGEFFSINENHHRRIRVSMGAEAALFSVFSVNIFDWAMRSRSWFGSGIYWFYFELLIRFIAGAAGRSQEKRSTKMPWPLSKRTIRWKYDAVLVAGSNQKSNTSWTRFTI